MGLTNYLICYEHANLFIARLHSMILQDLLNTAFSTDWSNSNNDMAQNSSFKSVKVGSDQLLTLMQLIKILRSVSEELRVMAVPTVFIVEGRVAKWLKALFLRRP